MTAVLIPTAAETEWLEARRHGVTASEIAVLMGLSPYSSPYALYHRKLGLLDDPPDTDAMALGRYLEDYVCRRFQDAHPELAVGNRDRRYLFSHPERPWQLATPDALLREFGHGLDPVGVLEAKTSASYDGWGDDGTDRIPVHYRAQVLWQMDVLGVTAGFVACLFLHSRRVRVYQLGLGPAEWHDLDIMRIEAQLFLDRLAEGRPPDVDWRPATSEALKRLHPTIEDRDVEVPRMPVIRYRAAIRAYKAAVERKALAENRLRELLGNGHRITCKDQVVARRDVYDLPEKQITRKATTVDRLVAVPAKEGPS